MQLARPVYAPDPRQFGRRGMAIARAAPVERTATDDLRLFAMTFIAGFLFVSILIG